MIIVKVTTKSPSVQGDCVGFNKIVTSFPCNCDMINEHEISQFFLKYKDTRTMEKTPDKTKLLAFREEIDAIDSQLVKLVTERMQTAAKIADYKRDVGMPVFDPVRERQKLAKIAELAGEEFGGYSRQLYSLIFELTRDYENKLIGEKTPLYEQIIHAIDDTPKLFPASPRVACQGTEGAYSMYAAEKLVQNPQIEYVKTFEDVIRAVETGYVRYGILPIENSTAGEVGAVYKLLEKHPVYIVKATRVKVEHSLMVNPGVELSEIKEIISHEQAIGQCSRYIETMPGVKVTYAANTAVAARMVKESGRRDLAAISSHKCAQLYGLKEAARDIQNTDNNYTRFLCISKDIEIYPGADKTSVMLVTENEPGSLYKVLSRFFALGISLTSLLSKPIEGRDFEFRFFLDFDTSVYSPEFAALIQTLDDCCEEFRYMGSYREAR